MGTSSSTTAAWRRGRWGTNHPDFHLALRQVALVGDGEEVLHLLRRQSLGHLRRDAPVRLPASLGLIRRRVSVRADPGHPLRVEHGVAPAVVVSKNQWLHDVERRVRRSAGSIRHTRLTGRLTRLTGVAVVVAWHRDNGSAYRRPERVSWRRAARDSTLSIPLCIEARVGPAAA